MLRERLNFITIQINKLFEELVNKHSKYTIILMILYKFSMELLYALVISPTYSYMGQVYEAVGWKYIISWVAYGYMIFILPKKEDGLKEVFLHIQIAVTFVPLIVFYALANKSTIYLLMIILVISLEIHILCKKQQSKIGISTKNIQPYVTVFMMIFILAVYLMILIYGGFYGLKAFDFENVYKIRSSASYPLILEYIMGWLQFTIIPFFILLFLEKKRYIIVLGLFVIMLMMYMTLGNKYIYASLVVIIGGYIISHWKALVVCVYAGLSIVNLLMTTLFLIEKPVGLTGVTSSLIGLVGDRFFFEPALNKYLYYECFSVFPKAGFADGIIGRVFGLTYPYRGSMGQTAFAYLYNGRLFDSNSNTGYLGDSYGQAGFVGMLITGILLALFVKLLCDIGQNIGRVIMCPLLMLLGVLLNDSAFISIFLSSGWAILTLFLIIYAKPKGKIYKRSQL